MPDQILTLAMGGGLDRHTGPMIDQGDALRDARNILLGRGFARLRDGAEAAATFSEDVVCAIAPLSTERISIGVAYDASTRAVNVYRMTADAKSPTLIGKWFDLHSAADTPPRVITAEAGGLLFLAHDEPRLAMRAPTVYYDPATASLHELTADWVGGDGKIRFAGVCTHFTYLAGWGFGDGVETGPHIVRHSLPGQPTVFERLHYMVVGQRGDPIMACREAAGTLHVWKRSQRWEFLGSSRLDFDVVLVDEIYGIVSSRALVVLPGEVIFWSDFGPRSCTRGPSVDLALPLGLDLPEPADLETRGADANAFGAYLPGARVVEFDFGKRAYALSLEPRRQWVYYERGFTPFCAALLMPDSVITGDPGYVTDVTLVSDEIATSDPSKRDVTVSWTNVEMAGDEVLEFWLRPDGDDWSQVATTLVGAGMSQQFKLSALEPGTDYDLQIRARRAGNYREAYGDSDPDNWPIGSYLAFTTELSPPEMELVWSRVSSTQEKIAITLTPVHAGLDLELYRDDGAGGAFTLLATIDAGTHNDEPYTVDDVSDDEGLGDPNGQWGERIYRYRARTVGTSVVSGYAQQSCWAGPLAPTDFQVMPAAVAYTVNASWTQGDPSAVTELEDDFLCPNTFVLNETAPAGIDELTDVHVGNSSIIAPLDPVQLSTQFRIRHKLTSFTIDDYSDYVTRSVNVIGDENEDDGYQSCP